MENQKNKTEKGITLIALIVTIIILLIIMLVTINSIIGEDDLIGYSKNAAGKYQEEQEKENGLLQNYLDKMEEIETGVESKEQHNNPGEPETEEILPSEETRVQLSTITSAVEENTKAKDEYGNKITIPAGFKLASDSGTDVTQGIVIEDVNNGNAGSQFVWIPCGTIYTNNEKTESKTITLSRYTFASDGTPSDRGDDVVGGYYQELATSTYGNIVAKDINAFKASVADNGGYYIGRYEAGNSNGTLVCKKDQQVYANIRPTDAATKSRNMYNSENFTSDLINSYAWDTAIIYIQKFGTGTDASKYSKVNNSTSLTVTGGNNDEYCKINDMSGNAFEWTTETSKESGYPCVCRGGCHNSTYASFCTCERNRGSTSGKNNVHAFRPLIYV